MAQDFENGLTKNITNSATTIYTSNSDDCCIGIRICNTTASQILMDVFITRSAVDYYLAFNVPIPAGGQFEVIEQASRIVLLSGDVLKATSDTATSADAVVSLVDAIS